MDELQLGIYYDVADQKNFFTNIFMTENKDTLQNSQVNQYSKISLQSLNDMIKKLC